MSEPLLSSCGYYIHELVTSRKKRASMDTLKTLPAAPGRRFGAFIIDYLIVTSVGWMSCLGILAIILLTQGFNGSDTTSKRYLDFITSIEPLYSKLRIIIPSLELWLYSTFLESSKWQATIGKRLFSIYVTNEMGHRLNFKEAGLRAGIKILCGVMPGIGFPGFGLPVISFLGYSVNSAMILLTDKHQGIHDKGAKTFVVERQIEMSKNIVDQRAYHINVSSGEKILIVTGDNPVLTGVQVGDINFSKSLINFAEELSRVRDKVEEQPPSKDRDITITILNAAEDDAKRGDVNTMKERLSMLGLRVGNWVMGFAVEVGANLVAEALIHIAGLK